MNGPVTPEYSGPCFVSNQCPQSLAFAFTCLPQFLRLMSCAMQATALLFLLENGLAVICFHMQRYLGEIGTQQVCMHQGQGLIALFMLEQARPTAGLILPNRLSLLPMSHNALVQDVERLARLLLPCLSHIERLLDRLSTAAAAPTALQQLIGRMRDSLGKA